MGAGGEQGTVLVVDDDRLIRGQARDLLTEEGLRVVSSSDGKRLSEIIRDEAVDVLLLDLFLPETSGLDLLRVARSCDPLLPVLIITGHASLDSAVEALKAGAYDYIQKPLQGEPLRHAVLRALTHRRLEQENQALLHKLEAQVHDLKRLEAVREQLTQLIVHDLKVPLTSVMLSLDILAHDVRDSQQQRYLREAKQSCNRLVNLIANLLDIAMLEEGRTPITSDAAAPGVLVQSALAELAVIAEEEDKQLEARVPPDLPLVPCDGGMIQRVLANLLANAVEHSEPGSTVLLQVVLVPDTEMIRFDVSDQGKGIPLGFEERIFDKFSRVDPGQSSHQLNRGLGLTFCKLAVEAHGGRIWVRSQPNQGSTFSFSLPLRKAGEQVEHPHDPRDR